MSVNVEQQPPPPPLFSQQAPSPSFNSPPQSPNHLQHTQTPVSSPPPPPQSQQHQPPPQPADVDMSTSTATLPPAGQRHDREDTEMQDGEGLTNGHMETQPQANENSTSDREPSASNVAVEVAVVDEDAMDTTPDENQQLVLPNGSVDPQEAQALAQSSPTPNGVAAEESGNNDQAPPAAPTGDAIPPDNSLPPAELSPPVDPNTQPPPPPPPVEPVRTDSDSSDDDDGGQPWHPIQEDTSSPDETELKEIEATTEHSALDHDHWQGKAFSPLEEPEYTPGESGRIDWTIDAYNGTREKPNREIVMKSQVVTIGGYDWQIKFYPKGNDSDYLSVYVECLSVDDKEAKADESTDEETSDKDGKEKEESEEKNSKEGDQMETTEDPQPKPAAEETPREPQHAPLPLLDSKTVPKRKSVAAQVSVVLYNPTEPRVNYSRTCLHRFCAGSPDWGWTRFHGPYYDIAHRMRGQRQALLRDDKLAFTGYIRIINDETDNLWEHHSRENPWDSFAMTGLQSLMLGEETSAPGGNMISAIATWMLFKPFRNFLYSFKVPDPDKEPFIRPKPLISALQKVLYMLRTQVEPGSGSVTLDDVLDALEWYGIHERLDKLDVVEIWEVLRVKIEVELQNTPYANATMELFGPRRDYTLGTPSYRAPVLGVSTMQEAVNKSANLTLAGQPLPQLLTIELERQEFDSKSRSYVKVMNKVSLDDNITVHGTPYTLYGLVVHKQTLQSYIYQPVLRPEGPNSRWYSYSDSKDDNVVRCLTKRQAIEDHEGKASNERVTGNDPIAYIVMYIRDDVAESAFKCDAESERWEVPEWLQNEIKKQQLSSLPPPMPPMPPMPPPPLAEPVDNSADNNADTIAENIDKETKPVESAPEPVPEPEPPVIREFRVYDSKTFAQHEGPGLIDVYDSKWEPANSDLVRSVQLAATDGCQQIREKVAALIPDIKDPRQVKFWFLNPIRGALGRPHLIGTGKIDFSSGIFDRYTNSKEWSLQDYSDSWDSLRLWIHVIDFSDLPELPPEPPKVEEPNVEPPPPQPIPEVPSNENTTENETATSPPPPPPPPVEEQPSEAAPEVVPPPAEVPPSEAAQPTEDTPMSEPDEPTVEPSESIPVDVPPPEVPQPPPAETSAESADTAMVEVASAPVPDPPAVDVVIPNATATGDTAPADTEMGGTQEDLLPPPPPPPADFSSDPPQPPNPEDHPPTPPRVPSPPPPPDEIYFFLKIFRPETQTLEARGSHIVLKSARVDNTVSSLLGLASDQKFEMCEEEELLTTRPLKLRRSFAQVDLHNTSIVIVTPIQTPEQRTALAARAAFADPQAFLTFRASQRNFADRLNGHFTHSSFSSQFYKGEFKNGYRHGHGYRIYHSGATYEGTFCLGQRHGHGLYTFQNGDTYDGDWVANQQHGSGTFVEAATGNTYVGGWKNDKKFGEGVTHWKNAQEAERLCRICWEDAADTAFYDCGHVVACLQCAREVQTCPVCRKRVLSAMKLYYVA